jgi:hypothetical protein
MKSPPPSPPQDLLVGLKMQSHMTFFEKRKGEEENIRKGRKTISFTRRRGRKVEERPPFFSRKEEIAGRKKGRKEEKG